MWSSRSIFLSYLHVGILIFSMSSWSMGETKGERRGACQNDTLPGRVGLISYLITILSPGFGRNSASCRCCWDLISPIFCLSGGIGIPEWAFFMTSIIKLVISHLLVAYQRSRSSYKAVRPSPGMFAGIRCLIRQCLQDLDHALELL